MTTERTVRALDDAVEDAKTLIGELRGEVDDLEIENQRLRGELDSAEDALDEATRQGG